MSPSNKKTPSFFSAHYHGREARVAAEAVFDRHEGAHVSALFFTKPPP